VKNFEKFLGCQILMALSQHFYSLLMTFQSKLERFLRDEATSMNHLSRTVSINEIVPKN